MSGFNEKVTNDEIFNYPKIRSYNFPMDQDPYPSNRITVVIRLTSAQYIGAIRDMLEQILQDFECRESGTVIAVSGYPSDRDVGPCTVLAVAQRYDVGAVEET